MLIYIKHDTQKKEIWDHSKGGVWSFNQYSSVAMEIWKGYTNFLLTTAVMLWFNIVIKTGKTWSMLQFKFNSFPQTALLLIILIRSQKSIRKPNIF